MDTLKSKLKIIFPTMSIEEEQRVIDGMESLGVESENDLEFVKPEDLVSFMPLVKARRFLSSFGKENQIPLQHARESPSRPGGICSLASDSWFNEYAVPWHKFPDSLIKQLSDNQRPLESDIRIMIHITMTDLFNFTRKPSRNQLRSIARRFVMR
jgi:hypothetical protein